MLNIISAPGESYPESSTVSGVAYLKNSSPQTPDASPPIIDKLKIALALTKTELTTARVRLTALTKDNWSAHPCYGNTGFRFNCWLDPVDGSPTGRQVLLCLDPIRSGLLSSMIYFNPAKVSFPDAVKALSLVIERDDLQDRLINEAILRRIDRTIDFHPLNLDEIVIQAGRKSKVRVFKSGLQGHEYGDVSTGIQHGAQLGTALVVYSKAARDCYIDKHLLPHHEAPATDTIRFEDRSDPKCTLAETHKLPLPFSGVRFSFKGDFLRELPGKTFTADERFLFTAALQARPLHDLAKGLTAGKREAIRRTLIRAPATETYLPDLWQDFDLVSFLMEKPEPYAPPGIATANGAKEEAMPCS